MKETKQHLGNKSVANDVGLLKTKNAPANADQSIMEKDAERRRKLMKWKRNKWKPKDISVAIEQGEIKFSAYICYSERQNPPDNSPREYSTKNTSTINKVIGLIHRYKMPCWKIRESFSDRKGEEKVSICFSLHYYPLRQPARDHFINFVTKENETVFRSDFGYITKLFNAMVS